jgi:hypothetical protein
MHVGQSYNYLGLICKSLGGAIRGLTATQISFANGMSGVCVSFTPSSPSLQNGYRVTVGNGSLTTIQTPPVIVMATGMGVINIRVEPLSRHYLIAAIQNTVTLNGIIFSTCMVAL